MKTLIAIALVWSCSILDARAQSSSELGLLFTTTDYMGDLSRKIPGFEDLGWGVGFTAKYMLDKRQGFKFFIGYLDFTGSDLTVPRNSDRGWETEFGILEASFSFEYHPFGRGRYNFVNVFNKHQLSPFFYIGLGVAMGDAEVFVPSVDQGKFPEEADRDLFPSMPIGCGLRYDLAEQAILTLDMGVRPVFSDYLDGISQGSDRNDWYSTAGISITILLHGEPDREI